MDNILEVKDLSYYYQDGDRRRYILNSINHTFSRGVFYTIVGESGSGKTTLLSLLSALDYPKDGSVLYMGHNIKDIGYEKYRRNNVGIIFQNYNLIPHFTAIENVLIPMYITDNKYSSNREEIAYNLLDYIGIVKSKAVRPVVKLSGGEQQRVAIARALSTNVDIILADEPTGNLDDSMELEIVEILKNLAHEHQKCVIVVTHSEKVASISDVSLTLSKGELKLNEWFFK